ncbi:MAG TPA: Clp protease N-terminal domain-containing protein [Acidimicrobiales bacterium]|jgi:hypothetical protein
MFRGDDVALTQVMQRAIGTARDLGHPRVGSEHLLLALVDPRGPLVDVFSTHGVTEQTVRNIVIAAAPAGAGAAADSEALNPLGISVEGLLDSFGVAVLDRAPVKEPWFPIGARRARKRCASGVPPIGLDAQAAYEASLRLAIARRERKHQPQHLALALVALDPGVSWMLTGMRTDRGQLLSDLVDAFAPPRSRLAQFGGAQRRSRDRIVRRYQRTSGRIAVSAGDVLALLGG